MNFKPLTLLLSCLLIVSGIKSQCIELKNDDFSNFFKKLAELKIDENKLSKYQKHTEHVGISYYKHNDVSIDDFQIAEYKFKYKVLKENFDWRKKFIVESNEKKIFSQKTMCFEGLTVGYFVFLRQKDFERFGHAAFKQSFSKEVFLQNMLSVVRLYKKYSSNDNLLIDLDIKHICCSKSKPLDLFLRNVNIFHQKDTMMYLHSNWEGQSKLLSEKILKTQTSEDSFFYIETPATKKWEGYSLVRTILTYVDFYFYNSNTNQLSKKDFIFLNGFKEKIDLKYQEISNGKMEENIIDSIDNLIVNLSKDIQQSPSRSRNNSPSIRHSNNSSRKSPLSPSTDASSKSNKN